MHGSQTNNAPSSARTAIESPSSQSSQKSHNRHRNQNNNFEQQKLGGPKNPKPRPYPFMLEALETRTNKLLIQEYENEINGYYLTLEISSEVNPKMIDSQPEIQWYMRPFLLDFIIEMHSSFKLKPQTLFLCINIIDRYCAKRIVFKQHYQLIGCTALWLAAKYEDKKSRVPTIRELAIMCRHVYDDNMFKEMEMHMLSTLDWSLGHNSLEDCLQLAIKSCSNNNEKFQDDLQQQQQKKSQLLSNPSNFQELQSNNSINNAIIAVGRYLCELSLFERSFLLYPTSIVAITAHLIACSMLGVSCAADNLSRIYDQYFFEEREKAYKQDRQKREYQGQQQRDFDNRDDGEFSYGDICYADYEDDEEMYDEDGENKKPELKMPFIGGFEGSETILQIKRLSLLFLNAINNPSEVLIHKYQQLGVITVVNNFLNKHYTFLQQTIQSLNFKNLNIDELSTENQFKPALVQLTDLILGLNTTSSNLGPAASSPSTVNVHRNAHLQFIPPHHPQYSAATTTSISSPPPPLTPSSSTSANSNYSSSSIFSDLKTPNSINGNNQSTMYSAAVGGTIRGGNANYLPSQHQLYHQNYQPHQQQVSSIIGSGIAQTDNNNSTSTILVPKKSKHIIYPNSSPVANTAPSSPSEDDYEPQQCQTRHQKPIANHQNYYTGYSNNPASSPLEQNPHNIVY